MQIGEMIDRLGLSAELLQTTRRSFSQRIRAGIERDGEQIRALRTYLAPPRNLDSHPECDVAVVDVGGTNCRAAVMRLKDGAFTVTSGPVQHALPVRQGQTLSGADFFALQASLLADLGISRGLPLGYCFSYPTDVLPSLDARLIRWTKGVAIGGVEGQPVGAALRTALARLGVEPSSVVVLNDTVAGLIGGGVSFEGDTRMAIGLIAGTGSNMAGFFDTTVAPKLRQHGADTVMALNLESGNFCPPSEVLTPADDAVDRLEGMGHQRHEKAVSGHYLPFLFAAVLPDFPGFDPHRGTAQLDRLADDETAPSEARQLASALLDRSADLIAVGLAALLDHYPPGTVGILAEGALFWSKPSYSARVQQTLDSLVSQDRFRFLRRDNVNLIGAASAAVSARS
jgi:hexokinase